jgi:hypothetical protein
LRTQKLSANMWASDRKSSKATSQPEGIGEPSIEPDLAELHRTVAVLPDRALMSDLDRRATAAVCIVRGVCLFANPI